MEIESIPDCSFHEKNILPPTWRLLYYIYSQCKSKYLQSIDICQFPDMFTLKTKPESRVKSRGSQAGMTPLPEYIVQGWFTPWNPEVLSGPGVVGFGTRAGLPFRSHHGSGLVFSVMFQKVPPQAELEISSEPNAF